MTIKKFWKYIFFSTGPSGGAFWKFWIFYPLHFPNLEGLKIIFRIPEERENLRIWRTSRGFAGIFEDWFFEDLKAFKLLIPQG